MAQRSAWGWSWSWGPIAIALAVLAAVLFAHLLGAQREIRQTQAHVATTQQQLQTALDQNQQLRHAAQLIAAPTTLSAVVRATPPAAQGHMYLAPGQAAVVVASYLPPTPAGRRYQLWLLPAQGNPMDAGTFQSGADGTAVYISPTQATAAKGLAVSLEPEGGSPQPTGPIVLAAQFSQ